MKTSAQGYRVAIVGASSLLGKELVTVLEERRFPVSQLITVGVEVAEPDLPIIDLSADFGGVGEDLARVAFEEADAKARQAEVDFAFLANRSPQSASFLDSPESERWRRTYAIAGVPTVLFIRPDGGEVREARVQGFLAARDFLSRMRLANVPAARAARD